MIPPIVATASVMLAVTSALDGYWTNRAQKEGAVEVGRLAHILYGDHPSAKALIFKGGAMIGGEIAVVLLTAHYHHVFGSMLAVGLFVQSAFHIAGAISGITFKD